MGIPRSVRLAAEVAWLFIVIAVAAWVVFMVLTELRMILIPVIFALLIAVLLVPLKNYLCGRGAGNTVASIVVFLGAIVAVAGLVALLAPMVILDAGALQNISTNYASQIQTIRSFFTDTLGLSESFVAGAENRLIGVVEQRASEFASGAFATGRTLLEILVGIVVTIMLAFFFVKDGARMADWAANLAPRRYEDDAREMLSRSWEQLGGFLRGVAATAAVEGVLVGILLFVLGVPFAIPIAVLAFFAAFIPLVGAILSGAVAVTVTFITQGAVDAAIVLGGYFVIQQLEGNVLSPLFLGHETNLHPAAVLIAVTVGGVLWGLVGAFLAVPILVVIVASLAYVNEQYGERGREEEPPNGQERAASRERVGARAS